MKKNKGYVYDYRSWKLRFLFFFFFFHQNNFGPRQRSRHEMASQNHPCLEDETHPKKKKKEGIHLKTPPDSIYWHFPCVNVTYSTIGCTVTIHSTTCQTPQM